MCDPVTTALMLGGTAVSTYGQTAANRSASRAAMAAQERQAERGRQAAAVIDQLIGDYTPERQGEVERAGADQIHRAITAAVDSSRVAAPVGGTAVAGRTSDDFLRARGERTAEELDRSARIARILGQIGGATRGRETQAYGRANAAADVAQIGNFARGDAHVDQARIRRAGQPNAAVMAIGSLMSGAGAAGAGGAGGSAAGGAPSHPAGAAGASMSGPELHINYPRVKPTALR